MVFNNNQRDQHLAKDKTSSTKKYLYAWSLGNEIQHGFFTMTFGVNSLWARICVINETVNLHKLTVIYYTIHIDK